MAAEIAHLKMDLSKKDAELSLLQRTHSNSQESGTGIAAPCSFVLQQKCLTAHCNRLQSRNVNI